MGFLSHYPTSASPGTGTRDPRLSVKETCGHGDSRGTPVKSIKVGKI